MLNLLRNKFQMHLFAPEPLSVTVLSRQEAEAQAPTLVPIHLIQPEEHCAVFGAAH